MDATPARENKQQVFCAETPAKTVGPNKKVKVKCLEKNLKTLKTKTKPTESKKDIVQNLMDLASQQLVAQRFVSPFKRRYLTEREVIHDWW